MTGVRRGGAAGEGEMIYFAHIGKTAGTSFRHAATSAFGRRRCVALYSTDHKATDRRATEIYFRLRPEGAAPAACLPAARAVLADCAARDVRFFSTHHNPVFRRLVPPAQIVTFLREPVARLISHYNFALGRGWITPDVSFEAFATRPTRRNLLTRSLPAGRFDEVGLVAISELYDRSLVAFHDVFGVELPALRRNRTRKARGAIRREDLPPEVIARVEARHGRDVALYAHARAAFERRWGA